VLVLSAAVLVLSAAVLVLSAAVVLLVLSAAVLVLSAAVLVLERRRKASHDKTRMSQFKPCSLAPVFGRGSQLPRFEHEHEHEHEHDLNGGSD
jgi:ABC-type nickel/cobalt efflux system permease component RcnA